MIQTKTPNQLNFYSNAKLRDAYIDKQSFYQDASCKIFKVSHLRFDRQEVHLGCSFTVSLEQLLVL
jgi:hypothetical protein